ncbi:MAG: hypothetical protein NW223_21925 [Hyphomicrobiaceae bacterium]|nr:hypothetical protein [Hyphomicrobiaceae bacterium]
MSEVATIERLNTDCTCVTLDLDRLCRAAEEVVGDPAFCREMARTHPNLLSAQPLFLSQAHAASMDRIIRAIETVVAHPAYQVEALEHAPDIARFRPGPAGVFMGYDFHLGPAGPKLIEINTNAGGALINAYLLQAHRVCCAQMRLASADPGDIEVMLDAFVATFRSEWRRQGRSEPLRSVAIVDTTPKDQYLYPEFVLFERLFQARGLGAVIAAPEELAHRDGGLWLGEQRVDLVYNRLTDFSLSTEAARTLRHAYVAGSVVLTPNPHAHALYANKRNLALLGDEAALRRWGIPGSVIATLQSGIPRTELVANADRDDLWRRRGHLFFKPAAGYGSKAAYRGDKLTRKVWAEIQAGDYIAQELVPPSSRAVAIDGRIESLKADLRNYTYDGKVLLRAARLYQGQTTNFRSPGGGFAPVVVGRP